MIDETDVGSDMTRVTDPSSPPVPSPSSSSDAAEGHVCPFCGLTREISEHFDPATPCPRCTLSDNSTTRNATKARVGPWYVRQVRNPWAPGMRFETLLALVKRRQVTRESIVRGPTTHQLWKRAAEVKGLSREFGVCYSCGGEISTQANLCQHCNRLQEPPANPDVLVEARESASSPPSLPPTPQPTTSRPPAPMEMDADEAPRIDISTRPLPDPDEMLSATDDQSALARKITSRPPVRQPGQRMPNGRPPAPPAPMAPASASASASPASPPPSPAPAAAPRPPRAAMRPHQPGSDDALLTPQELATAFQLDFNPDAKPQGRSRRGVVLVVLLLLAIGAGVLMYLRPDWRRKGSDWSMQTYTAIKTFIVSRTSPAPTPPATRPVLSHPIDEPKRDPITIIPPAAPTTAQSVIVNDDLPAPKPAAARVATDIEPPAPVAPAIAKKVEPAVPAAAPAPAPPPVVVQSPPPVVEVPAPVKPAEPKLSPYEQSKLLWGKAIDAEINQDFVEAVKCYEQIKKLPEEYHQNDLDLRLARARRLTK